MMITTTEWINKRKQKDFLISTCPSKKAKLTDKLMLRVVRDIVIKRELDLSDERKLCSRTIGLCLEMLRCYALDNSGYNSVQLSFTGF